MLDIITKALRQAHIAITDLFHKKNWRNIGIDQFTGAVVIVPNSDIIQSKSHIDDKGNGFFSLSQTNESDVSEIFLQLQFKDYREVEKIADSLFNLRMKMRLKEFSQSVGISNDSLDTDDLEYVEDYGSIFLNEDKIKTIPVCIYKTEKGEMIKFPNILELSRYMDTLYHEMNGVKKTKKIITLPQVRLWLDEGVLVEVIPGYQIRYEFDKNTFIPKEKIGMVTKSVVDVEKTLEKIKVSGLMQTVKEQI